MLHAAGGRSAAQVASSSASKFDAALADISRHLGNVRPDFAISDLHALNPAARFMQRDGQPLIAIDATTTGDPQRLKAALLDLGLQQAAVYSNDVGGWLPVARLDAAVARAEVQAIRAAMPRTRTGAVTSQGDVAQQSNALRSMNALSGAGVTVGVLSDSFNCYAVYAANPQTVPVSGPQGYASNGFTATAATDIATGDLPASVKVLQEASCLDYGAPTQLPFGDEGRAMLQIVHDVAPGAALAFYTAENSEADFANGIGKLAASPSVGGAGAAVIADDVGYFDEPFFQDGLVTQAVNAVAGNGVAYFSAAGNNGANAYDNNAPSFAAAATTAPDGQQENLLNFDSSGATQATSLTVDIPSMVPGEFVAIVLEWDQPYVTGSPNSGGAANALDLCLTGVTGNDTITNYNSQTATCSGPNGIGTDPYQVMIVGYPANATGTMSLAETVTISVGLVSGATPGRIKVVIEDDGLGSTIEQFATNSPTLQGHPGAAGAAAVGAVFFADTPGCGGAVAPETFSSLGGDPILFDTNGNRLPTPVIRQKPDFLGPDGVANTFLGFPAADGPTNNSTVAGCQNISSFPSFFGTSAATPHVGSIAALMLQANPSLTASQIFAAMRSTATNSSTFSFTAGFGLVQAEAVYAALPQIAPAAPTLTLAATSIVTGSSTTLSWTGANSTRCNASGSWSGAMANQGTITLSPTAVGTSTYTLTCANATGASPAASVNLMVTSAAATQPPPSTGGGGGGKLDWMTLLALLVVVSAPPLLRRRRLRSAGIHRALAFKSQTVTII